jgi:ethanolamine utilization microcompartment shell protein EutL
MIAKFTFEELAKRFETETLTKNTQNTIWEDAWSHILLDCSKTSSMLGLIDAGGFIDAAAMLLPPGWVLYAMDSAENAGVVTWYASLKNTSLSPRILTGEGPTVANAMGAAAMLAWSIMV